MLRHHIEEHGDEPNDANEPAKKRPKKDDSAEKNGAEEEGVPVDNICDGYPEEPEFVEYLMRIDDEDDVYEAPEYVVNDNEKVFCGMTYPQLEQMQNDFLSFEQFTYFREKCSQVYFWHEYIRDQKYNESFGGLRGAVWRASKQSNLKSEKKLVLWTTES